MLGTGGTSCFLVEAARPGDGDRKVRSVIELTLGVLDSLEVFPRSRPPIGDDSEEARRWTLLDGASATFVSGAGCARKAAAAAADDNDGAGLLLPRMYADAAAMAASGAAVSLVRGGYSLFSKLFRKRPDD